MSYQRRAYEDASSTDEMAADCAVAEARLRLPRRRTRSERTEAALLAPPPSIRFDDYPREVAKSEVRVSEAASRLAAALHLHLD